MKSGADMGMRGWDQAQSCTTPMGGPRVRRPASARARAKSGLRGAATAAAAHLLGRGWDRRGLKERPESRVRACNLAQAPTTPLHSQGTLGPAGARHAAVARAAGSPPQRPAAAPVAVPLPACCTRHALAAVPAQSDQDALLDILKPQHARGGAPGWLSHCAPCFPTARGAGGPTHYERRLSCLFLPSLAPSIPQRSV